MCITENYCCILLMLNNAMIHCVFSEFLGTLSVKSGHVFEEGVLEISMWQCMYIELTVLIVYFFVLWIPLSLVPPELNNKLARSVFCYTKMCPVWNTGNYYWSNTYRLSLSFWVKCIESLVMIILNQLTIQHCR